MSADASKSMRLLYEAAAGADHEWVANELVMVDVPSRQKQEEVAYAWAAAYTRATGATPSGAPAVPTDADDVPVLSDAQLGAAAARAVQDRASRSAMLRMITYSLAARHAARFVWQHITEAPEPSARSRLIRILKAFSNSTGYTNYGDNYVEARLRLLLPSWSVTTTPAGLSPHEVSGELLASTANDLVRPIIDEPIRAKLQNWSARREATLCAAVVTMQELTGGEPALNINEQALRRGSDTRPSIVVFKNGFTGQARMGLLTGKGNAEVSAHWSHGAADCLYDYLVAARDMGVEAVADVASAVLDNNCDSPVYFYLTAPVES